MRYSQRIIVFVAVWFSLAFSAAAQRRRAVCPGVCWATPRATISVVCDSTKCQVRWDGFSMKAGATELGYYINADGETLIPQFSFTIQPQGAGKTDEAVMWDEPLPTGCRAFEVDVTGAQTFSVSAEVSPPHPLKVDASTKGVLFLPELFSTTAVASLNGSLEVPIVGGGITIPDSFEKSGLDKSGLVLAVCDGVPSKCLTWVKP
jgi:hypothetical protein